MAEEDGVAEQPGAARETGVVQPHGDGVADGLGRKTKESR